MPALESTVAGPVAAATAGGRPAVEVAHLRKAYGTLVAVDDVSFTVAEGDPADVGELLDVLGLAAKRGDYYRSLSCGQRQRLSVALVLAGYTLVFAFLARRFFRWE